MNRSIAATAALLAGALAPAAVGAAPPTEARAGEEVTVLHWWTSPSESAALGDLVKLFEEKNPGTKIATLPMVRGVRGEFAEVRRRIVGKLPLDSFQASAGYGRRVFFDADFLSPVDDLWANGDLERAIPPLIRDLNRINGRYYSVPVNVHRTNVIWYNKPLLEKHGIDPASLGTWPAFFKAVETLTAAKVAPIQLGTTWTMGLAFESIMASQGIEAYEDWINGRITDPADARLASALRTFKTYVGHANPDHAEVEWDTAIGRVMKGEGAFSLMGDWADGEFRRAGMKYGKDYGAIVVPETRGMYGVAVDTFVLVHGEDRVGATRWMRFVASREGQDRFNPPKGSIPARTDADTAAYGPYQRSAIADFRSARYLYPNGAAAVPEVFNSQLNNALVALLDDGTVSTAAAAIVRIVTDLRAKGAYLQVWSLKQSDGPGDKGKPRARGVPPR
jgi:glucose/mannose transport system substrate-binding protein